MSEHPVRIDCFGICSALGGQEETHMQGLLHGRSAISKSQLNFGQSGDLLVGSIKHPLPEVPEVLAKYRSRNARMTLYSLDQILLRIKELIAKFGAHRIGVVMGSSTSGIAEGERAIESLVKSGERLENYSYSQQELGSVANLVAEYIGAHGPAYVISNACSSSAKVFSSASELLALNICDAVVTGGIDSLCGLTVNGFASLDLVSKSQTNPFSENRSGLNLGEGGAVFVLTREPGGVQLLGIGEASDAHHMSSPHPQGRGAILALSKALNQARIEPKDVSYINLHGTGTILNDAMEAVAVKEVFGSNTWCSSTKPMVGHLLGASGAIEIAFCTLLLKRYLEGGKLSLPRHIYDGKYDTKLDRIRLVEEQGVEITNLPRAICVSNSFGFGGNNCAVVIGVSDEA